jgi:biopolymer transport protein ExbD
MSAAVRGRHKRPETEQDFELNIASVIDCFTVLITYLLISASFISITAMDIDLAGAGSASRSEPPPISLAVELDSNRAVHIKVTGQEKGHWVVEAKEGNWDLDGLAAKLAEIKGKYPTVESAFMSAEEELEYREVVKVVEATKRSHPSITLGDKT